MVLAALGRALSTLVHPLDVLKGDEGETRPEEGGVSEHRTALAPPFLEYCGGGGMVVARREGGGEGRVEEDEVLLFTSSPDLLRSPFSPLFRSFLFSSFELCFPADGGACVEGGEGRGAGTGVPSLRRPGGR